MKKAIVLVAILAMVAMVGGMAHADLNTDLVGYWNFDQDPGTVVFDQSVNGNDGTIRGDPTWVDGVCGNALDFDGVDDYVELPDIDLVPNPFTICAWVNIQDNNLQGSHYIFGRTHGNVAGEYNFAFKRLAENETNYCLYFDAIRDPAGTTRNAYEAAWTNEPSPMGWHFYCASWDGVARCPDGPGTFGGPYEGVKLYIDGVLQTNVTPWGSCDLHPRTGTHLTAIGAYEGREPPTPAPRSGFAIDPMDEVRIYGRELSAEEIQDLYEAGRSCLTVPVSIDIKPGSDPNCFNINGHGVIPVAILGSADLDVNDINADTLSFNGLAVRVRGKKGPLCTFEDSNGDGSLDLVCHFEDEPGEWVEGNNESATLTGELVDDTGIEGTDSICIVP